MFLVCNFILVLVLASVTVVNNFRNNINQLGLINQFLALKTLVSAAD